MALLVKQGIINSPSTVGLQTIDVGFEPKVIMVHSVGQQPGRSEIPADSGGGGILQGFATSPTNQVLTHSWVNNTGASYNYNLNTHLIYEIKTGIALRRASLSSISSTGFTLNWDLIGSQSESTPSDIHYVALGGDDVLNAKIIQTNKTVNGNHVITGLGFKPNTILTNTGGNRDTQGIMYSYGVATPTSQWALSTGSAGGTSSGSTSQLLIGKVVNVQLSNSGIYGTASLTSFDPDGFTMNFTDPMLSDFQINVLALNLATPATSGFITQPATTGVVSYEGFQGTPQFMMFSGRSQAASTGFTTDALANTGWTDGTQQISTGQGRRGSGTPTGWSSQRYGSAIATYTTNMNWLLESDPPTSEASVSFDQLGFTADWTRTDGGNRQIVYLAFQAAVLDSEVHEGEATFTSESHASIEGARTRSTELTLSAESETEISAGRVRGAQSSTSALSSLEVTVTASLLGSATLDSTFDSLFEGSKTAQTEFSIRGESDLYVLGGKRLDSSAAFSAQSGLDYSLVRLRRPIMRNDYNGRLNFAPLFGGWFIKPVKNMFIDLAGDLYTEVEFDTFGAGTSIRLKSSLSTTATLNYIAYVGTDFEAVSDFISDGQKIKQTGFGLDASTELHIIPSFVRTSDINLAGALDSYMETNRRRQGRYNLSSRLDTEQTFNADFITSYEYSSDVSQALTANRLRELEGAFSTESEIVFDLARIKAGALDLSAQSEVLVAISFIASTGITLESVSSIEVVTNAHYVNSLNLESMSNLSVSAKPLLLVTYEDALGHTRRALIAQGQVGEYAAINTQFPQGKASYNQKRGIIRSHVKGK